MRTAQLEKTHSLTPQFCYTNLALSLRYEQAIYTGCSERSG